MVAIVRNCAGSRSAARRRHTSSRVAIGHSTESMPSSFTPRRMNGRTVVFRSVPPVSPEFAIAPLYIIVRVSHASVSPPTTSTAPAQSGFSTGRVPICSVWREITSLAPSDLRYSCSPSFPVSAVTRYPRAASSRTARLPTPPVAPVTITGPWAGESPLRSRSTIESAAVNPAVPIVITSSGLRPSGTGTTQSAGTRTIPA